MGTEFIIAMGILLGGSIAVAKFAVIYDKNRSNK